MAKKRKSDFSEYQQVVVPVQMEEYAVQQQIAKQQEILEIAKQQSAKSLTAIDFMNILGLAKTASKDAELFTQDARQQLIQEIPNNQVVTKLKAKQVLQNIDDYTPEAVQQLASEEVTIPSEAEEAVLVAVESIDDFDYKDLDNLTIKEIKSKAGYTKTKVTVKSNTGGKLLSKLATKLKSISNGLVTHRKCDLRLIGNTNKTQLRSFGLKLTKNSYTFKPTGGSIAKGTRVIISIADDFESSSLVYVYIQKSRDKFIKEIELTESSIDWLAQYINEFYHSTFDIAKQRLNLKTELLSPEQQLLLDIMVMFTKTKKFEVLPIQSKDDESELKGFLLRSKGTKNQWLMLEVLTAPGGFILKCKSRIKRRWSWAIHHGNDKNRIFGEAQMLNAQKIIPAVESLFTMDWKKTFNVDMEEDALEFFDSKLTYRKLRQSLEWLFIGIEDDESARLGLTVLDVLSQKDTAEALAKNGQNRFTQYKAETIIGKINGVDYFALSYLAVPEVGGDKRHGSDYITRQQYYEKYDVRDRGDYQDRRNTVIKREGESRNYNSRKFMFQLEYAVDTKKSYINGDDFNDLWKQLIDAV